MNYNIKRKKRVEIELDPILEEDLLEDAPIESPLKYKELVIAYKDRINYKNIKFLEYFLNPEGKIKPRTQTLLSLKMHNIITKAIKKARMYKLIPFLTNNSY
jgi:ribosomal protein S18